jgi:hypothetical protein
LKEVIIISLIAFFATAWVLDSGAPPQAVKTGINGVVPSSRAGNAKKDEVFGDFKYTEGYRDIKIRTMIYDDKDPGASGRNDSDFPLSGGTVN